MNDSEDRNRESRTSAQSALLASILTVCLVGHAGEVRAKAPSEGHTTDTQDEGLGSAVSRRVQAGQRNSQEAIAELY